MPPYSIARARLVGLIGTLLPYASLLLLYLAFSFITVGAEWYLAFVLFTNAATAILVLYAVLILSKVAGAPGIFRLYLASVATGAVVEALLYSGAIPPILALPQGAPLVGSIGTYLLGIATGALAVASFTKISWAFNNRWFLWCGRLLLLEWFTTPVMTILTTVGLVAFALQLASFNSLKEVQPVGQRPLGTATSSSISTLITNPRRGVLPWRSS